MFCWTFFYSLGAQEEIDNTRGMHFDRHRSCYSLRFYQFIPYLAGYGQSFALCTELFFLPFTDIFIAFALGT